MVKLRCHKYPSSVDHEAPEGPLWDKGGHPAHHYFLNYFLKLLWFSTTRKEHSKVFKTQGSLKPHNGGVWGQTDPSLH